MTTLRLYASSPARRTRQVVGDVVVLAWVVLWVWLGAVVHDVTLALAAPGRGIERSSGDLSARLREAGDTLQGIPLVGDRVRVPLDDAGRAAQRISEAAAAQVVAVEHLALWLGVVVAVVPAVLALAAYVPLRWRFVREATAGQRFVDTAADLDLFALRAMARQPLHRLARVSPDPVAAWRTGDGSVVRALAMLELRDAGLPPPPVAARGTGPSTPG
jgi:hypothetical protein